MNDSAYKAVVRCVVGERAIFCGVCGHKIARAEDFKPGQNGGKLFVVCNHKSREGRCKTINEIEV